MNLSDPMTHATPRTGAPLPAAHTLRALLGLCALALVAAPATAQTYNRIVDSGDIQFAPSPSGGWDIRARAFFANQTSQPVNLSSTLTIGVNGVAIGTISRDLVLPAGSPGQCSQTCAPEGACLTCKPSIVPGLPCYCCTHVINSGVLTVASLNPGDVITATITPLPGSAPESITQDDWGFLVIPPHIPYNRTLPPDSLRYEPSPSGGFMITGQIAHEVSYGETGNLSSDIFIFSDGVLIGGGHGGGSGGECGSTDFTTVGNGHPLGPAGPNGPMMFDCVFFCLGCSGYDVNVCVPPGGPTPEPICFCHQACLSRIIPGPRWGVEVPPLSPDATVTIRLAPLADALPELDTSDDALTVRIADITPSTCTGDYNQDGGIDGADVESFFHDWEAGTAAADVNADGGIDGADVATFFEHWEAGC